MSIDRQPIDTKGFLGKNTSKGSFANDPVVKALTKMTKEKFKNHVEDNILRMESEEAYDKLRSQVLSMGHGGVVLTSWPPDQEKENPGTKGMIHRVAWKTKDNQMLIKDLVDEDHPYGLTADEAKRLIDEIQKE